MTLKGILTGAAALAALGMALVDVNNAEAGRRRCCCNSNGWSGGYGTNQTTGYGPMNQAPPAPQTYDGSAAAPAPGYNQGNVQGAPYGTQYGPRGTTVYGPNGAAGTVRDGTTTVNPRTNTNVQGGVNTQGTNRDGTINPRANENIQGGQTAPAQRNQNNRQRNDGAAPPAPGSTDSSDSTQK
jgi:hypothetical protein